jgi:hypothetical protein
MNIFWLLLKEITLINNLQPEKNSMEKINEHQEKISVCVQDH